MDISHKLSKWTSLLVVLFVVSIIFNFAVYMVSDRETAGIWFIPVYTLMYGLGPLVYFMYRKQIPNLTGGAKMMMSGIVTYSLAMFIGLLIWSYFNIFSDIEIPYPSIADVAFVFTTVGSLIAAIAVFRMYKIRITGERIAEFIAYFVIASAVIFLILGEGISYLVTGFPYVTEGESFGVNFFDVYYAFSDAFFAAVILTILRLAGGKIFKGLMYFVIGSLAIVVADIVLSYRIGAEIFWNGDVNDTFFMLGAFFFGMAILATMKDFADKKVKIG